MNLQAESYRPAKTVHAERCEHALVARLKRSEDDAYAELVQSNAGRLLATARRLLKNESAAEDVVQKTFISAFQAIGSFSGNARLSTWLHRIVVNYALMKLRSDRRRPEETIDALWPRFDEQGASPAPSLQPRPITPESNLSRQETRLAVRSAVDRLPPSYRTVIVLRDIEEWSTEETALSMGLTRTAVKVRLHRARQALKAILESELVQA